MEGEPREEEGDRIMGSQWRIRLAVGLVAGPSGLGTGILIGNAIGGPSSIPLGLGGLLLAAPEIFPPQFGLPESSFFPG